MITQKTIDQLNVVCEEVQRRFDQLQVNYKLLQEENEECKKQNTELRLKVDKMRNCQNCDNFVGIPCCEYYRDEGRECFELSCWRFNDSDK